jgi:hypothetical protein
VSAAKKPAAKAKSGAAAIRKIALSMPEAVEEPHFELVSFRVNKKIFATASADKPRCMVKLAPELQQAMTAAHPKCVTPVPGTWGARGSTWVATDKAPPALLRDLIASAWANVAPKKLLAQHAPKLRGA